MPWREKEGLPVTISLTMGLAYLNSTAAEAVEPSHPQIKLTGSMSVRAVCCNLRAITSRDLPTLESRSLSFLSCRTRNAMIGHVCATIRNRVMLLR
jgi:hypothetical protein